ncbi:myosin regulatory light chain 2 [Eurytemora carolleeae]|uniref:myosin regulatory light chain 2 n=1 Tax=Eurytemora carolleeae TaxID=1294199 RepID=UPI000C75AAC8|nr:myosin regulatory light chain 2 [Eurytemora carolleeae]|eukprot:XP_023337407.1 myosin regulatory light chain 2-like [Eurytemora affinis]
MIKLEIDNQYSFPYYRDRNSFLKSELQISIMAKGSKKAKKGANVFTLFSQKQIQEFKEAFGIIDNDKDGIVTANDLKTAFAGVGKTVSDSEVNNMLGEAPGPVNFTQMVTLFAEKMAGGADDDDVIIKSFEAFEINGQIDAEM